MKWIVALLLLAGCTGERSISMVAEADGCKVYVVSCTGWCDNVYFTRCGSQVSTTREYYDSAAKRTKKQKVDTIESD